jgi:transcriptional regulator NrdR family protein
MNTLIDVVKRSGQRPAQSFDREKFHRSIYAACLSVRVPEGEAASIANRVSEAVTLWLNNRPVVTSSDLRRVAGAHLHRYHPDAAYFYHHHRYII